LRPVITDQWPLKVEEPAMDQLVYATITHGGMRRFMAP
jgi:hypothetical protein